jgi:Arm DNA-binding domain
MALTLFAIQNAKRKEKPYKLSDGEGLHLLVQTNGSKLCRFRYQFGRKEKMLSLGTFPEVSLAQAGERKKEARKLVAEGIDPSEQRKKATSSPPRSPLGISPSRGRRRSGCKPRQQKYLRARNKGCGSTRR